MSRAANPVPTLIIAEPPEHKGVLGKVKGFFASIFK
jgi:hypothetical protein